LELLTMSRFSVLEQANAAATQANWPLLNRYLQQLLDKENRATASEKSELLQKAGTQLLTWALEVLEAGDFQERWDVAKIFPSLGTQAIEPLIAILQDQEADTDLRWFAGRILGEFHRPEAIAALAEILQTAESQELSAMAADALANSGPAAIEALTDLLAEEDSRLFAVRALAQIGHPESIKPLLSTVRDPVAQVRTAAIEGLIGLRDERIGPVLLSALSDPAASVRRQAVTGLGLRADTLDQLQLVQLLRDRLWDFNFDVCQQAAFALGRLGTPPAAAALSEALLSPATPVPLQIEVVRALGWIGTIEAVEYLRQALPFASPALAQEIVTVLGRSEHPATAQSAGEILTEVLKSDRQTLQNPAIQQAAALALAQLGDRRATDSLIQLLASPDAGVRLHAIAALKQLAPEHARRQLQDLANNPQLAPALREGIAFALREWPL
jgi:HEAT repeat protein